MYNKYNILVIESERNKYKMKEESLLSKHESEIKQNESKHQNQLKQIELSI